MRNIVHTLAFNLTSEVRDATRRLYSQNSKKDFTHYIVDCEFPIVKGDEIPDNIREAKAINSWELQKIANDYGSQYFKIENKGVSQNWSAVYEKLKPFDDNDMLCCCDADEVPIEDGWVKALGDVLRIDKSMGYAAPTLIDNKEVLARSRYAHLKKVGGYNVYVMTGSVNYGLLAISGKLLNKLKEVPVPGITPIYGNIEGALIAGIKKYNMQWCILKDYTQIHTNVPPLYRAWKDDQIFGINKHKQIPFEEWLILKQKSVSSEGLASSEVI